MIKAKKFYGFILRYPRSVLVFFFLLIFGSASLIPGLRLDASSDSLLLRGDPDLAYFRASSARYENAEFLILTWEPNFPLLSEGSLGPLVSLIGELQRLDGVRSVNSILDVPLLESPPLSLTDLARADQISTLRDSSVDRDLALAEFRNSPIYKDLLVSESGDLTAIQVVVAEDQELKNLLIRRETLRLQESIGQLDEADQTTLRQVEANYDALQARSTAQRDRLVSEVRSVADNFREHAHIFVGGVPMIAADMVAFVRADLIIFSFAIIATMALVLWLIFRNLKWVFIPLFSCITATCVFLGMLSATGWNLTVISSNSVAVLLVVILSLSIHLVVKYRELQHLRVDAARSELAEDAALIMMKPCIYTVFTTMFAFVSLLVAGIQPVIDFGWMMTAGIIMGFLTVFTLVPALMVILPDTSRKENDYSIDPFTLRFARVVERFGAFIVLGTIALIIITIVGMRSLEVENRFIDYFKKHTEIYKGMELLDAELGGTIPLDIILSAPTGSPGTSLESNFQEVSVRSSDDDESYEDDFFDDSFAVDFATKSDETGSTSFWFSLPGRILIDQVHTIVESKQESGKVMSLATTFEVMDRLYGGRLGGIELALIQNSLPTEVKDSLIIPYFDRNADEVRVSVRVMETSESLNRDEYLNDLREEILQETGIDPDRLHFTSLLVLYNNVLQSLFSSQIMTLGAVFIAIGIMFWLLFGSITLALIALAPNVLAACLVLGMMGLWGIPLDIMTITIAAIVVGMGVDNCIHYLHRFKTEIILDNDYNLAMYRSHGSIGRAMFYTTLTVVVGFSMLTLSNFTPSLYFGILTVIAMIAAVTGGLLLLPKLILIFRPFGHD